MIRFWKTRSVAADDLGNAFVASQLNGGGVLPSSVPSPGLRPLAEH